MGRRTRRNFLVTGGLAATACWLAQGARGGAQPWIDRRTYGPFECIAAFPLSSLEGVFQELSRLELELQRTLALPPANQAIDVFLLADESSHRRFLADLYPRAPYRRALYVQRGGWGAVYAYQHDELPIDLRHECTHALLHTTLPIVPLWLDEGLAEYFELAEADRAFRHPHFGALRWNLRLGMLRTVESLEAQEELSGMGGVEYRYSWAWVHFMLHGPLVAHRALVEYLANIRRGEQTPPLSQRLRAAVPELDDRMIQHFRNWPRAASTT